MDDDLKRILIDLHEAVLGLYDALDESALNETALIAALKELLPGFGPRFEQLRIVAEKQIAAEDRAGQAAIRASLDKMN
ncbi:MAG TPA: hypothetical protein VII95_10240 [Terriglobales bacterium]|jgi:hypothetical protein